MCAKRYENPTMLSRVTAKNVGDVFFETHCRFFILHFCCREHPCIFNHFYVIRSKIYRIWWNYIEVRAITPFKVTDFGTNRKPICDFLLAINSNLPRILHHFRDTAFQSQKSLKFSPALWFNPRRRGSPGTISVKFYLNVVRSPSYYTAQKHCRKFQ